MVPAGFHSHTFNSAEKNYPTYDKMLAIIDCLKKFKPHLTGIKFDILMDNCPLLIGKLSCPPVRFAGTRLSHDLILRFTTSPVLPTQQQTLFLATSTLSITNHSN